MNVLLDTVTFLWWVTDDDGLSVAASEIIGDPARRVFLSPVSGWEILTSSTAYWIKAALLLLAGFAAGFVATQIRRQMRTTIRSTSERDRAVIMFGQHVSPKVAEMLLRQTMEFSGEERNVCVMFLDIRDFSRLVN